MRIQPLLVLLLLVPAATAGQRLQPADARPVHEIRATHPVTLVAEVFLRESGWLEVRGEIRSGESGPVVVEVGQCPVILVAYGDRERTRALWTGSGGGDPAATSRRPEHASPVCTDPDTRIRRQVTPTRGHPLVQRFRVPPGRLPAGLIHFAVITAVNGERRRWAAGSLVLDPVR